MQGVLFLQSQEYLGADTMMHTQLMRYFDRSWLQVHVAYPSSDHGDQNWRALRYLRTIPGIAVRRTYFGPSLEAVGKRGMVAALLRLPLLLWSLLTLAFYIRRNRIGIIHCTEKPRDTLNAFLLSKLTGAKYVVHLHVKWENWINPAVRWAMRRADAVIAVSAYIAGRAIERGRCAPHRVFHAVNGIEPERWDDSTDGSTIRREFAVAEGTVLLGIIARLFVWKGHLDLLKALALVKQASPNFKLLIVGEDDRRGAPGRPPLSQEIRALCHDLDLDQHVIFTGVRKDIPRIMAALDIYTMPSFEEPCAVVYLEAMAMRKPVVALRSGGTPEEVADGLTGFLCDPGDAAQYAERVLQLMRDAELRATMGRNARERIDTYLNARRMARDVERIYATLMQPPAAPSVLSAAQASELRGSA